MVVFKVLKAVGSTAVGYRLGHIFRSPEGVASKLKAFKRVDSVPPATVGDLLALQSARAQVCIPFSVKFGSTCARLPQKCSHFAEAKKYNYPAERDLFVTSQKWRRPVERVFRMSSSMHDKSFEEDLALLYKSGNTTVERLLNAIKNHSKAYFEEFDWKPIEDRSEITEIGFLFSDEKSEGTFIVPYDSSEPNLHELKYDYLPKIEKALDLNHKIIAVPKMLFEVTCSDETGDYIKKIHAEMTSYSPNDKHVTLAFEVVSEEFIT